MLACLLMMYAGQPTSACMGLCSVKSHTFVYFNCVKVFMCSCACLHFLHFKWLTSALEVVVWNMPLMIWHDVLRYCLLRAFNHLLCSKKYSDLYLVTQLQSSVRSVTATGGCREAVHCPPELCVHLLCSHKPLLMLSSWMEKKCRPLSNTSYHTDGWEGWTAMLWRHVFRSVKHSLLLSVALVCKLLMPMSISASDKCSF